MSLTITLDKLNEGKITLTRNSAAGEDTALTVDYTISTQTGQFPLIRSFQPNLTAQQKTQLNAIWDAVFNAARNKEGV